MGALRRLRAKLGWTAGWRDLLRRSGTSLIPYFPAAQQTGETNTDPGVPKWALLPAEVWETARSVIVRIEVPGMGIDDIDIAVGGRFVEIRGHKRTTGNLEGHIHHLRERAFGRFTRKIALPCTVAAVAEEISSRDGVITLILPKNSENPPTATSSPSQ